VQTCLASKSRGERYPGVPPAFAPSDASARQASADAKAAAPKPAGRRRASELIPLRRARCTRLPVKQS